MKFLLSSQKNKHFIEEHLEQKCIKEDISVKETIYLFLPSLEAKSQGSKYFYFVVLHFKAEIFGLKMHLTTFIYKIFETNSKYLR